MDLLKLAGELEEYTINCRRHLHRNPELSGMEEETVRFICDELDKLGVPYLNVETGGVLGFIDGSEPGKTVLLRADIDALPMTEDARNLVQEKTCVSEVPGVAHTCGHDAHTAMLLGATNILWENRQAFKGSIILFFERGEEGRGYIYHLIRFLEENDVPVDGCFGMHLQSDLESGRFAISEGPVLAGNFGFDITIKGVPGPVSRPDLYRSPIECFAALNQALDGLRLRKVSAYELASYSIGLVDSSARSGDTTPEALRFAGTCRFFSQEQGGEVLRRELEKLVETTCSRYGCTAEFHKLGKPGLAVQNHSGVTQVVEHAVAKVLGREAVVPCPPRMGSESYVYLSALYPSSFGFLGIRNDSLGSGADHHNPRFDVDESVLKLGVAAYAAVALEFLESDKEMAFTRKFDNVSQIFLELEKEPPKLGQTG